MKKFAIMKSERKTSAAAVYDKLAGSITANGGSYVEMSFDETDAADTEKLKDVELVICVGGDGTFLQCVRLAYPLDLPVLGVNTGRLGFLTDVERDDVDDAVKRLINDDYDIQERMMLKLELTSEKHGSVSSFALNDIVVKGQSLSRIVDLSLYLNNEFIDNIPGDGVVISSPTGSTAYSLAAGGPIVEPEMDALVVTPICPHLLYSRSFVIDGSSRVRLLVDDDNRNDPLVTVDGKEGYPVTSGDVIEILKAEKNLKVIKLHYNNFYSVLCGKLYQRNERG